MAKYWMHNGLMQASSEIGKVGGRNTRATEGDQHAQEAGKIAKSKGASAFSEMLQEFPAETIRFFLLSTHYRRPIDFSLQRIRQVGTGLETFYRFFKRYQRITGESFYEIDAPARRADAPPETGGPPLLADVARHREEFLEAMDDDFNTGGAVGVLFELVRRLNKFADDEKLEEKAAKPDKLAALAQGATTLRELAATLGLFRKPPAETAAQEAGGDQLAAQLLDLLVELRGEARKAKNFATADKIRNSLAELGVTLEDRPGGTEWARD